MWLTLDDLRAIADKIEHGKREATGFLIYLRCRDIPVDQLPVGYRAMLNDPIPSPRIIPPELKLSPHPDHGTTPDHLKYRKH